MEKKYIKNIFRGGKSDIPKVTIQHEVNEMGSTMNVHKITSNII